MKKIIIVLLTLLCLAGCTAGGKEPETKEPAVLDYSIVSPSGAPSLALLDLLGDDKMSFDIVDGSEVLQAEFTGGNADVIIAPVNLGAKLASATGNYKLVAVLTWGNLYLVSGVSAEEAANAPVAAFGEAAVPGKVLGYLADELGAYSFEWFNSVNEANAALLAGEYQSAVLAEPVLTMAKAKYEGELNVLVNIQEAYKEKTGYDSYPQAALFVNVKDLDDEAKLNEFLDIISMSIESYNGSKDALSERIDAVDLSVLGFANADLIKNAYSRMALDFRYARDCENEINAFLSLFGMELDEGIVY
ncbi:MAG: hypothetical protein IKE38_02105 [Erysipelotrichaceae bacterium]|nr:hypothetical protein [Erysipelotrichaceae bacterium]